MFKVRRMAIRVLSAVCAVVMLSANVFAAGETAFVAPTGGDTVVEEIITIQQQIDEINSNEKLTPNQKIKAIDKLTCTYVPKTRSTTKTLNVTFFEQLNSYYCGPATTKQTIDYLMGSASSQTTIAAAIGTTSSTGTSLVNMKNYINNIIEPSYNGYYIFYPKSKVQMYDKLMTGIDSYGMPPIVAVTITSQMVNSTRGLKYATGGHFMSVTGYDVTNPSDRKYRVTDPYKSGHGIASGKYYIYEAELYNAIMTNSNQRFAF